MSAKKYVLAVVSSFVTMMVLSGLFHRIIMGSFFDEHLAQASLGTPNPLMILSIYLPISFVMAYMYPKGYEGGSPAVEGFRFGALIGLVMIIPLGAFMGGLLGVSMIVGFVDIPWHVAEEGVAGAVIGLVYGRFKD